MGAAGSDGGSSAGADGGPTDVGSDSADTGGLTAEQIHEGILNANDSTAGGLVVPTTLASVPVTTCHQ